MSVRLTATSFLHTVLMYILLSFSRLQSAESTSMTATVKMTVGYQCCPIGLSEATSALVGLWVLGEEKVLGDTWRMGRAFDREHESSFR
ncbi:hypothetical protein B0J14DRAFT_596707 [Halenospora varia]|nr:hypothetical protein B0J14DRAFT_596707 [Halenospora varia]